MKPLLMSDKDALKCGKQRIAAFGDRISLIKVNHFKSPLKRLKKPKTTLKVSRIRVTCSWAKNVVIGATFTVYPTVPPLFFLLRPRADVDSGSAQRSCEARFQQPGDSGQCLRRKRSVTTVDLASK
jgi:hypothetical protein